MKKLTYAQITDPDEAPFDPEASEYYRAEDVENLLREITRRSEETGQLLTIKCDVTDFIGPIIGYERPAQRRSGDSCG